MEGAGLAGKPKMQDIAVLSPIRIARAGGDPDLSSAIGRLAHVWIPAFAGKAVEGAGLARKPKIQDITVLAPTRIPRAGGDPDLCSAI